MSSNSGANDINITNNETLIVGTVSAGQNINLSTLTGDVDIDSPIELSSSNTLKLQSPGNIAINASIEGTGNTSVGNLELSAGGSGTITDTGAINVNNFSIGSGNWYQNNSTLPVFTVGNDFNLGPDDEFLGEFDSTFTRVAGGDGSSGNPYLIADIYGLQGAATLPLNTNYKLANSIDATVTQNWNTTFSFDSGEGFDPIALTNGTAYTGVFNGNGFTISNLTILEFSWG